MRTARRAAGLAFAILSIAGVAFLLLRPYALPDYLRLRNYSPPAEIVELVADTTMTDKARHLFYINRPQLNQKADFAQACPFADDETIVIGCYLGGQRGIHILSVDDERLAGVEEVTAAHEMLHAAFDRLGREERGRVETMLQNYADNGLTDERIKNVLVTYLRTEPGQQLNEMHSIFGTEISNLPADLETYYEQYFGDRSRVTSYASRYQEAFTSRQKALAAYDAQLKELGAIVEADTKRLEAQERAIRSARQRLEASEATGDIDSYNAQVQPYNALVDSYNALLQATRNRIDSYNKIVADRNAIAAQTAELQEAISSSELPQSQ